MFATSKMLSGNTVSKDRSVRGRLRISDFMGSSDLSNSIVESQSEYRVDRSFMTDAYRVNAWIRAIVDLSSERFAQTESFFIPLATKRDTKSTDYPDDVKRNMETASNMLYIPNSDFESFSSIKKKVIKDVLIYDEGGIQIGKGRNYINKKKIAYELRASVTGAELYVNAKRNGVLNEKKTFLQIRNNEILSYWDKYEFINFIKNVRAGYANGFSPIESVAESILGDIEAMNYNLKFFENNARPNIAFLFNNLGFGPGKQALERAKKWYQSEHKGKPHSPLFMGTQKGEVKIQELTVSNKDMEFSDWQLLLLSRIMAVYGMQPMVLGILTDTTGKLNSEVQSEQYKKNTIIPLVKLFCNMMNSVLVWGDANLNFDNIYLTSSNLDIDDEDKQAKIWEIFLRSGVITINQVRDKLQMPPVDWGNEPFVPLNFSPLSILREYQMSRIEANRKNAMNDGIDNNVDGVDDKKKKVKKKDSTNVMVENYEVPTGLEKVDPTIVKDVVAKLIKEREKKTTFVDFSGYSIDSLMGSIQGQGLSWSNVLKSR